jgi:hypothetical protein
MLIESRRDLVRLTIVHRPHRPDHRTEANKLHRRCKMNHLVQTCFVSDSRVTRREIRKFGILQITPDDPLDCKVSVVQSERGLERPFPIWETMAHKVDPFVLAKFFNDPRSATFLSIYTRECGEAVDTLANVVQFRAHRKEFALAGSFGLTNGNETFLFSRKSRWIAPSSTNEGSQGWGVGRNVEMREISFAFLYGPAACKGSRENAAVGHHQMRD